MRRLVESWTAAEREHFGNHLAAAVREMNATLESKVEPSRVSEWKRKVYDPSPVKISYMLFRTLPWALEQAGLAVSPEQLTALQERLWVPIEEDGTQYFDLP